MLEVRECHSSAPPHPQDSRSAATDRPGKHGGGAQWPGTQLQAMGPKNQRALGACRSPRPQTASPSVTTCLGFLSSV